MGNSANKESTITNFADAEFPLIAAAWKGVPIIVKVRELSQVQLMACGNFSLIDLQAEKEGPFDWKRWSQYADQHVKLLKAGLVSPTYNQLYELVHQGDMVKNAEQAFKDIEFMLQDMPRGPKRQELEKERDSLRCLFDLMFPDDFTAPIVAYLVGIGKTDIKSVTKDMLLTAAVLAERGHDNPSDHIDGVFSAFNRDDINRVAWSLLEDERDRIKKERKHAR